MNNTTEFDEELEECGYRGDGANDPENIVRNRDNKEQD